MVNQNTLTDLFRQMEWADARMWASILATPTAQTDKKLQEYLHHLHVVQRVFLRIWRDEPIDASFPTLDDLTAFMRWARAYYEEAKAFLATVNEEDIAQPVTFPWAEMIEQRMGRKPEAVTRGETALQVVFHTTHHRGQISARLRELGGEPAMVDYIVWLWLGRPEPEWPSVDS
jgi:uncharacterized damage-inducible protein DinB